MRSFVAAFCVCLTLVACSSGKGSTGLPPLPDNNTSTAAAPPTIATSAPPASRTAPPSRTATAPPNAISTPPNSRPTALPGPVTASNPSTAIVDVNRSRAQPLGPNSPPPSSFENTCNPPPYLFQSKAGYEAVRVKDCKNDQQVYLPSSAQTQIGIYQQDCQRLCGGR